MIRTSWPTNNHVTGIKFERAVIDQILQMDTNRWFKTDYLSNKFTAFLGPKDQFAVELRGGMVDEDFGMEIKVSYQGKEFDVITVLPGHSFHHILTMHYTALCKHTGWSLQELRNKFMEEVVYD